MSEAVVDKVQEVFVSAHTHSLNKAAQQQRRETTSRMSQEGVVGVCVADELGLCVAAAGNVDARSAGVVTDIAQTAKLLFGAEQAPNTVAFIETQKTFVLSILTTLFGFVLLLMLTRAWLGCDD